MLRRLRQDRGWLPPVILAALTLWLTIITAGSVHRLHRMHVSAGQAARMAREMAHHRVLITERVVFQRGRSGVPGGGLVRVLVSLGCRCFSSLRRLLLFARG